MSKQAQASKQECGRTPIFCVHIMRTKIVLFCEKMYEIIVLQLVNATANP